MLVSTAQTLYIEIRVQNFCFSALDFFQKGMDQNKLQTKFLVESNAKTRFEIYSHLIKSLIMLRVRIIINNDVIALERNSKIF